MSIKEGKGNMTVKKAIKVMCLLLIIIGLSYLILNANTLDDKLLSGFSFETAMIIVTVSIVVAWGVIEGVKRL